MTSMNLTQRTSSGNSQERAILPTDSYRMRCIESKLEDDTFAAPNKDGGLPQKIALTFEVTTLTEEQQEIASAVEEDWDTVRIWHRFNPYYGDVRAGGPSKFKEFLDNLVSWGLLTLDLEAFDPVCLVGIELRCSVLEYTKTMGANAGQPGNKIAGFAPVRAVKKGKNVPQPAAPVVQEPDALEWDKPADMSSAEYRFFQRYEHVIGGRDWSKVQAFLKSNPKKPTTPEEWNAAAESVRTVVAGSVAEEDLPF